MKSNRYRSLVVLAFAISSIVSLSVLLSASCAEKSKPKKQADSLTCLVVDQFDVQVGKVKIYISRDAIRIDSMNGLATVIAKAPDWTPFIFNRDKEYITVSKSDWYERGFDGLIKSKRHVFKKGSVPVKFMGLRCLQASREGLIGAPSVNMMYQSKEKRRDVKLRTVSYIATSDLNLSSEGSKFLQGLWQTGPEACLMLEAKNLVSGEKRYDYTLKTLSIEKKEIPKSMFVPPKNYKLASTISAVITGKGIEEMMLNFSGAN